MYSSDFTYYAPTSLAEALELLQRGQSSGGETKLLAGGQSLIPLMKLRMAEPAVLIDVGRVPELRGVGEEGDGVVLGAGTTYLQASTSPIVQRRCPLVVQAISQVGDPQVRARGTIGGSLAHADPAGDLPAVAVALSAEIRTASPGGAARRLSADSFFVDLLTTALQPAEVVTAVRFPATDQPGMGTAYVKHRHPASGYAVVGVAALVRLEPNGTVADARVGITGAGTHAARAGGVEQALAGRMPDDATLSAAAAAAATGLELLSDSYASADFRAHLARVLTKRALAQAAARAQGRA
jgi:carbon-monoxide dehydrogenase medium subunit